MNNKVKIIIDKDEDGFTVYSYAGTTRQLAEDAKNLPINARYVTTNGLCFLSATKQIQKQEKT